MKNLLGGKGANLAEMNLIGVPVPAGFTITTDVCTEYNQLGKDAVVALLKSEVEAAVVETEKIMNAKFGSKRNFHYYVSTFRCPSFDAGYDGYHP
jgi:pyruvate, orthophosphate dikinase